MKKKKDKEKRFTFENASDEIRINVFMAISLCQMIIKVKYKRLQNASKIVQYINNEYIQNRIREGVSTVDYDFLEMSRSYFKYKFRYEISEPSWVLYYNRTRKTEFTNLKECLLYELNNVINENQRELIYQNLKGDYTAE